MLAVGCCLCTGDVLSNSAFHAWMGKQLPPLVPAEKVVFRKPIERRKPVFGEKIEKGNKTNPTR